MTGSNSSGSYRTSNEATFRAFDKLPPTARAALANAAFDWAVQPILRHHNKGTKGFITGKDIAASVTTWDHKKISKDRKRVWGIEEQQGKTIGTKRRSGKSNATP